MSEVERTIKAALAIGSAGKTYRAYHNEREIKTCDIDMLQIQLWPDGMWKASGWWYVWHMGDKQETIEAALRDLIDVVEAYAIEDYKATATPPPTK